MTRFIVSKKFRVIVQRTGYQDQEFNVTPEELRQLRLQVIKAERQKK